MSLLSSRDDKVNMTQVQGNKLGPYTIKFLEHAWSLGILYLEATRRKDHSENCILRRFLYIEKSLIRESIRIQRHRVIEKRAFSMVFLYYERNLTQNRGLPLSHWSADQIVT